jgi:hypothetical protein
VKTLSQTPDRGCHVNSVANVNKPPATAQPPQFKEQRGNHYLLVIFERLSLFFVLQTNYHQCQKSTNSSQITNIICGRLTGLQTTFSQVTYTVTICSRRNIHILRDYHQIWRRLNPISPPSSNAHQLPSPT